jgi:predicted DNA-binding transcriptional regulator AlpA
MKGGNFMLETRFIHAKEAAQIFGISKGTWFNWRRRGLISSGVPLGCRRVGWPAEEINALYERLKNGDTAVRKQEVQPVRAAPRKMRAVTAASAV